MQKTQSVHTGTTCQPRERAKYATCDGRDDLANMCRVKHISQNKLWTIRFQAHVGYETGTRGHKQESSGCQRERGS